MNIFFTKMQGLGNDFIVIDNFNGRIKLTKEEIALFCDRHKGIGADGLILVESSQKGADCFMNYYNSDGSEAEMCGNGIRCLALFLKNDYFQKKDEFQIETRVGIKKIIYEKDGTFSVEMGKPNFISKDFPKEQITIAGLILDFVSLGNPHAISMVSKIEDFDFKNIGPLIENDLNFPNKINFELVEKINEKKYKVLVWERGCGSTLSCGTGACAVYAILKKKGNKENEIKITMPGGELFVSENKSGEIILRGEARSIYNGSLYV